jgi:hypothetical protein
MGYADHLYELFKEVRCQNDFPKIFFFPLTTVLCIPKAPVIYRMEKLCFFFQTTPDIITTRNLENLFVSQVAS